MKPLKSGLLLAGLAIASAALTGCATRPPTAAHVLVEVSHTDDESPVPDLSLKELQTDGTVVQLLPVDTVRGRVIDHSDRAVVEAPVLLGREKEAFPGEPTLPEILVPAPTGTNRVTAGAIIQPSTASPGELITVIVKIRIASGHWIYALENSGSGNLPTMLVTPPHWALFRSAGPWRSPEPKIKEDGSRTYSGEVLLQRRFVVEPGAGDAATTLPLTLKYQVCNEALCWPPATISLQPALKVVRSR